MNKFTAINTLDYRLSMLGYYHPDSTKRFEYRNASGDSLIRKNDPSFGIGWYWYRKLINVQEYHWSKRSAVKEMEAYYDKN
jgi:hypothetical protein